MVVATETADAVKVRPRGHFMVVEPMKQSVTQGGVLLPETYQGEEMKTGMRMYVVYRILAVSDDPIYNDRGETLPKHDYAPGDTVIAGPAGLLVNADSNIHLLDERSVVAMVETE